MHFTYMYLQHYFYINVILPTSVCGTKCLYFSDSLSIFTLVLDIIASIRYCTPSSDISAHSSPSSSSNVGWSLSTSARSLAPWSSNEFYPRPSVYRFSPPHSSHMASSLRLHNPSLSSDSVVLCLSTSAAQISIPIILTLPVHEYMHDGHNITG